jgi:hypothetical protein
MSNDHINIAMVHGFKKDVIRLYFTVIDGDASGSLAGLSVKEAIDALLNGIEHDARDARVHRLAPPTTSIKLKADLASLLATGKATLNPEEWDLLARDPDFPFVI